MVTTTAASRSLPFRIAGVIRSPRTTFEAVVREPRWAGVLTVAFVAAAVSMAAVLETEVGQLALLDQWERTAIAFGRDVDDAQYAAMAAASERGAVFAVGSALVAGPLLAVVASALIRVAIREPAGARPSFGQVLGVAAHAGVILALRHVVAAPVTYARETLASPMTLNVLTSGLEEASAPARFLALFDVFVVWWLMVLALGVSVLYKRPARRLALSFLAAYIAVAAALAGAMALLGGTA